MCSSHSGEAVHVGVVRRMLERLDTDASALQCGRHAPYFYSATEQAPPSNVAWSTLHHNCSGKHSGFLACCRLHGESLGNYLDPDAGVQQRFRKSLQAPGRQRRRSCAAPTAAARPTTRCRSRSSRGCMRRLACDDTPALAALRFAMTRHPDLVSGTGRTDLALMQAGKGDWVSKIGADGVQAIGIRSQGHRHRDPHRRRQPARAARGDGRDAAAARPARRRRRHAARALRAPGAAQLARPRRRARRTGVRAAAPGLLSCFARISRPNAPPRARQASATAAARRGDVRDQRARSGLEIDRTGHPQIPVQRQHAARGRMLERRVAAACNRDPRAHRPDARRRPTAATSAARRRTAARRRPAP